MFTECLASTNHVLNLDRKIISDTECHQ